MVFLVIFEITVLSSRKDDMYAFTQTHHYILCFYVEPNIKTYGTSVW